MNTFLDKVPASSHSVLITRPAKQSKHLLQALVDRGVAAASMPFLELAAVELSDKSSSILSYLALQAEPPWCLPSRTGTLLQEPPLARSDDLATPIERSDVYDSILFVSANAVHYTAEALRNIQGSSEAGTALQNIPCIGMGAATAAAIEQQGWLLDRPTMRDLPSAFTSETLLASNWAENLRNKRILISRGVGGRETLGSAFSDRSAFVDYLETYERRVPQYDNESINTLLHWCMQSEKIAGGQKGVGLRVVVLGSAETALNFLSALSKAQLQQNLEGVDLKHALADCFLVVPSERVTREIKSFLSIDEDIELGCRASGIDVRSDLRRVDHTSANVDANAKGKANIVQLHVAKNPSDESMAEAVAAILRGERGA